MKKISFDEVAFDAFEKFGKEWTLISAYSEAADPDKKFNTMTASWGGVGVLWNKNIFFCVVRPQRFTKKFIDSSDTITLSFFSEDYRDALTKCGRLSGKDCDKLAISGLSAKIIDNAVFFDRAYLTLKGKKLFAQTMNEQSFIDSSIVDSCYPQKDFHTLYVCEITDVYAQ